MTPITDDELMKMLEGAEEGPITEYENDVLPFLSQYNIVDGDERVTTTLLYKLYKNYSANPMKKRAFVKAVNEFLVMKQTYNCYYYMINIDALSISKEYYKLVKDKHDEGFSSRSNWQIDHINRFIDEYDLQRGSHWLRGASLYELYCLKFRKQKRKPRLSYKMFLKLMKLYFENKYDKENWFGINERYKEFVSPEEIEKIREGRTAKRRNTSKQKGKDK